MRVAIVHDDLVQWGGAERVLEGICQSFPDAPLYTSVFDYQNQELFKRFGTKKIHTSFLQKIPGWKSLYKGLLPFYPIAFEQFDFSQFDLVISHTTRFAKSIITKPGTKHICYCHTPPRFLWHLSKEQHFGLLENLFTKIRLYDQISARRVDYFLAGSRNAQNRIKKIYKFNSKVVYPFLDLGRFDGIECFDGGYFLVVARLNQYKRVDLAIKACIKTNSSLRIIGDGPELDRLKDLAKGNYKVEFLGNFDDRKVIEVIAGCKGLIVAGVEDFGLTPLEAQALGKPVIAFRSGGVLETVTQGKTGIFFDFQTEECLSKAIEKFNKLKFNPQQCKNNAKSFSKEKFINTFVQTIDSLVYTKG